ncbi:Teichoic acid translocation permease protein TagG [Burkholderia multivorans]|uniref:ABC transporter permease n=1 Tax=Burkholderia multivorans TaxID=87883 RepID=UPI0015886D30|nr:ABC transporter permease [Burkholderia multivorans]MBU9262808.1 ABC transporter permease [Burkholderia multivorans]MBU9443558.1 ABC transporter permease [Burkholderia multivorans]MBU9572361.1 ABC transporter permease [Burkholderia multivorans]MDR8877925.1 Teichoic acid translocation permease protein TagG [Burkholderia multivorans]MDR8884194.1 Teichoic acid translocation permease protein TagG [Burkholderia multivorans]
MLGMLRALWAYRGFILGSVKREFQSKYRNSLLGAAWTVLNPLAMIVVYTVIFSQVMRARLPGVDSSFAYSIHLCAGVLPWGMFVEIVSRAQNAFIDNANLIKKLSFPRLCLPVIVVANALVNFAIVFGLFVAFLVMTGNFPGVAFAAVIPLLVLLTLFAIGLGITLGVLNVFFRDVGQFFGIVLNFWFWLTPIVYSIDILPKPVQGWMQFNPMASLIQAFQVVMMEGKWPEWSRLWLVIALGVGLCLIGFSLFRKHAGEMVDEL